MLIIDSKPFAWPLSLVDLIVLAYAYSHSYWLAETKKSFRPVPGRKGSFSISWVKNFI